MKLHWKSRNIFLYYAKNKRAMFVGNGRTHAHTHTNFVIFACLYVHYFRPNTHYYIFGHSDFIVRVFWLDYVVVACSIFHLDILRLYTLLRTHTHSFSWKWFSYFWRHMSIFSRCVCGCWCGCLFVSNLQCLLARR